jgi:hypothetical protein
MHVPSLIIAGFLAIVSFAMVPKKNMVVHTAGIITAGLAALMLVAGVSG